MSTRCTIISSRTIHKPFTKQLYGVLRLPGDVCASLFPINSCSITRQRAVRGAMVKTRRQKVRWYLVAHNCPHAPTPQETSTEPTTPAPKRAIAQKQQEKPAPKRVKKAAGKKSASKPPPAAANTAQELADPPKQAVSTPAALFARFATNDIIDPSGVEALCEALGVDASDRRVLLLAWRTNAQRMGYFERDEWLAGAMLPPFLVQYSCCHPSTCFTARYGCTARDQRRVPARCTGRARRAHA